MRTLLPVCPLLSSKCRLQGFAPSATISIRREERLMSLWSLCATNAQCMSLDLTQATFAEVEAEGKELMCGPSDWETLKEGLVIVGQCRGHSGMHLCTGRPSGSRRAGSPSSASTGCWSRASCSWRSETKDTHRGEMGEALPASTRLQAGAQQDRPGARHTAGVFSAHGRPIPVYARIIWEGKSLWLSSPLGSCFSWYR